MKQYTHHITTGMISGDRRSNWKIVSFKKIGDDFLHTSLVQVIGIQ
jgi:hypothetical protein